MAEMQQASPPAVAAAAAAAAAIAAVAMATAAVRRRLFVIPVRVRDTWGESTGLRMARRCERPLPRAWWAPAYHCTTNTKACGLLANAAENTYTPVLVICSTHQLKDVEAGRLRLPQRQSFFQLQGFPHEGSACLQLVHGLSNCFLRLPHYVSLKRGHRKHTNPYKNLRKTCQ